MNTSPYLLFLFAISLHNLEEALWPPQWSGQAGKFHKKVEAQEFHVAVMLVTLLAFVSTSLWLLFPAVFVFKYFYFGFLGAMVINTFAPHLAATVVLRKYSPGLLSGLCLLVPVNVTLMVYGVNDGVVSAEGLLVATALTGACLLAILPLFFYLGRKFSNSFAAK